MTLIEECHFQSEGSTCAGTLVLPNGSHAPPGIVMAHGFANVRQARLPAFAERFVKAGYATFYFDYRTFGDSEGDPRHWVHPSRQLQDWEAAIRYVGTRPEVDSQRLVLWGTSFSGGHVLRLAVRHGELAAVISQIPHVSGVATIAMVPPWSLVKTTLAMLIDVAGGLLNRPFYSAIIGEPGQRAAITGDGACQAYRNLLPADTNWENKVLSRSFLHMPFYSPRRGARRINIPTLINAARRDSVVPASAAHRTAKKIPRCTFHLLECDHFGAYFGDHFERNIALQLDFLLEHVPVDEK